MNTTHDIPAEEKLQIFLSRYIPLEEGSIPEITIDTTKKLKTVPVESTEKKEIDLKPVKDPTTDAKPKKEIRKINDFLIGWVDRSLNSSLPVTYYRAGTNVVGLYKDKPDPRTVQNNFIRKKDYPKNNITEEIDDMDLSDNDKNYLKLLQHIESDSVSSAKNNWGYKGLYQFGKSALKTVNMDPDDYNANTINQHLAALRYKRYNLEKMGLNKYINKTVNGLKLTENNLAAQQHLVGHKSVLNFINSNGKNVAIDRNNLPLTAYLILFQ